MQYHRDNATINLIALPPYKQGDLATPASPNATILMPYHTSVRGGFLILGEIGLGSRREGGEGVASKFTRNRWGDRGHNNQPLMGALKADSGL